MGVVMLGGSRNSESHLTQIFSQVSRALNIPNEPPIFDWLKSKSFREALMLFIAERCDAIQGRRNFPEIDCLSSGVRSRFRWNIGGASLYVWEKLSEFLHKRIYAGTLVAQSEEDLLKQCHKLLNNRIPAGRRQVPYIELKVENYVSQLRNQHKLGNQQALNLPIDSLLTPDSEDEFGSGHKEQELGLDGDGYGNPVPPPEDTVERKQLRGLVRDLLTLAQNKGQGLGGCLDLLRDYFLVDEAKTSQAAFAKERGLTPYRIRDCVRRFRTFARQNKVQNPWSDTFYQEPKGPTGDTPQQKAEGPTHDR